VVTSVVIPVPYSIVPSPFSGEVAFGASSGLLGTLPSGSKKKPFTGPKDTLRSMAEIALGPRGEQSLIVRQFTEWVTRDVWPKDYLGEILAIRNCFLQPSPTRPGSRLVRYLNDPRHVEWIKDPQRLVEEIHEHGTTSCDCDEVVLLAAVMGLQIGREAEFVALGFQPRSLTHVGARIKEPKTGQWIWVDPVAGPREQEAAKTAREVLTWSLD